MADDALEKVVREEALRQEGVARMDAGCVDKLRARKVPGVNTRLDRDGWLHVNISIVAAQSSNLHQIGATVQQAVLAALKNHADQPVGRVNVHVAFPKKDAKDPSAS